MPQSLRSILGKSNRVKKSSTSGTPRQRRRPRVSTRKDDVRDNDNDDGDGDDGWLFGEKLTDRGLVRMLRHELTLRDVVQAMRYIRSHMFSPVPETGLHSSRMTEVLNYRAAMPPVVAPGHVAGMLGSPSRVEREVVELWAKGVVRKVRVERRGAMGEALIEMPELESLIRRAAGLSGEVAQRFLQFLRENPMAQMVSTRKQGEGGGLTHAQTDELVRAGFLTSCSVQAASLGGPLHVRPEDRTTLTSIQRVSRFPSGTVSAVGGQNAVHLAGGGGGGALARASSPLPTASSSASSLPAHSPSTSTSQDFRIAIPGHGRHLKLVEATMDWLRDILGRTKWGEGPESWLKERFNGGGLYGTRWKELWGVEWEWVLGQAVGLGVVEVFDTGSVGRGVRALGA